MRPEPAGPPSAQIVPIEAVNEAPPPTALSGFRRIAVADDPEREHLRPSAAPPPSGASAPRPSMAAPVTRDTQDDAGARPTCTAAQLRRFIKSRPWVPMHELRRRFGIVGTEDDVTPIRVADQQLFVGLPPAEGRLIADLLAGGDVGYELSMDPDVPVVVGVYPMRPVPRT